MSYLNLDALKLLEINSISWVSMHHILFETVAQGPQQDVPHVYHLLSLAETLLNRAYPDSKVHGANMGPIWVLSAPNGPHVGAMNFAIWVATGYDLTKMGYELDKDITCFSISNILTYNTTDPNSKKCFINFETWFSTSMYIRLSGI